VVLALRRRGRGGCEALVEHDGGRVADDVAQSRVRRGLR
jgi:hypothetical protein